MSATRKNLRDQVLRVLLGGPAYGSQIVERLPGRVVPHETAGDGTYRRVAA